MDAVSIFRALAKRIAPLRWRPQTYLAELVRRKTNWVVYAGPFQGMKYVDRAFCSQLLPKIIGTYERELHPVFSIIFQLPLETVVDVGAAEGYYAVGIALRINGIRVVAFESNLEAAEQLAVLAEINSCREQIEIRGECDVANLSSVIGNGSNLVICDCEGFEVKLLDPNLIPQLRRTHILVEMHDFIVPGATEKIRSRFESTHRISTIFQEDRTRTDFPFSDAYVRCLQDRDVAPHEGRPVTMHWLWMEPIANSHT